MRHPLPHPDWSAQALPLDDRLFQQPLYVTHAGWEKVAPHQSYPRPGHPPYYGFTWEEGRVLGEFCLCLLTRGQGELQTKRGRQVLKAGQAFLYEPGEWHRHRPAPAIGWSIIWLNFNGDLPHRWLEERAYNTDKNAVHIDNLQLFRAQFQHLVESIEARGAHNSLRFSWQAIGLIAHFLAEQPVGGRPASLRRLLQPLVAGDEAVQAAKPASSGDNVVDAAMDYIWSQSHNRIDVSDVARQTGVNRRTLERRFKSATGTTLLNEIQRCRISRAGLLLRETSAPIKYIVGRAGFANYQRLREAFRKRFGVSPETYRRHALER